MFINSIEKISSLPSPVLGLLPAVHTDDVPDATVPLDTAAALKNQVFRNAGSDPLTLPAWGRWPARQVAPGAHFASDGRLFYNVVQRVHPVSGETSWFPLAFERVLYTIHFTPAQFVVGASFLFERQFDMRLIANTTNAVWSIYFEVGQRTIQTTPEPTAPNLMDYDWLPPMLEHQVVLTDVAATHQLGILLENTKDGYKGSKMLYDQRSGVPIESLPTQPDFAVRLRLGCFDTQNSVADPKGFAAYVAKAIVASAKT